MPEMTSPTALTSAPAAPAAAVEALPVEALPVEVAPLEASTVDDGPVGATIGDLARTTGLSVSAIRFYQRRGVLPAREGGAGWQRFGEDAVDRLAVARLSQEAGFSLDEVVRLMDAFDVDLDAAPTGEPLWRGLARHRLQELDAQLARLEELRRLLADALSYGALTKDRARAARAALGWDGGQPWQHLPVGVPSTPEGVHAASPAPVEL